MLVVFIAWIAALWFAVACLILVITLIGTFAQPVVQRRRASRSDQPPVSIILPIKLLHPGFSRAQASVFAQAYPATEILISAQEATSPALDEARRIADAHPASVCHILQSPAGNAASPKLNNLAAPLLAASHDFVFTKDSNITLTPDDLAAFMRNHAGDVGLICGVPVAVRAETYAAHIEAFLINGHARLLLAASTLGLGFGIGKATLVRRSDLAAIGGIEAIAHTIAEDSALSKALAAQGLRTVFCDRTIAQEIGARSWREVYQRQARWCVIRRAEEPLTYLLEPLSSPLPAACAATLAAPLANIEAFTAFVSTLALWCIIEIAAAALKGWPVSPWMPLAFLGREGLSLVAWLRGWTTRGVVWADDRIDVRRERRPSVDGPAQ